MQQIFSYVPAYCFFFSILSNKVSSNGYISFNSGMSSPTISLSSISTPVLAPFAADIDTRISGTISYKIIIGSDSDSNLLDTVSSFISDNQSVSFSGIQMFVAYYDDVAYLFGSSSEVNLIC